MPRLTNPKFVQQLTKLPWTSWTPTVTSASGALAHTLISAEYLKIGKILFYSYALTVSANGSGAIIITTPSGLTPTGDSAGVGREYAVTGRSMSCVALTTGQIFASLNDNGTAAINGYGILVNGFYKVA